MQPTDIAWAAGIFEGEGAVRITPQGTRNMASLWVSVTSTDPDLLQPLRDWFGGSVSKPVLREGRKPYQTWTIVARQAETFLGTIYPFTRVARIRAKIQLALEFQAQKQHVLRIRNRDEYETSQYEYARRMRELNVRGRAR